MPPKQDKTSTDRLYGLSEAELKTSISVLRLLAIDGNTPIDKVALAKLTGHEKPNTAVKIWSNARTKLIAQFGTNTGSSDTSTAGDAAAASTPTVKPAKRARQANKTKAGRGKKAAVPSDDDDAEEEHKEKEDDGDHDDLDEPALKRVKSEAKQEAEDDSF